MLLEALSSMNGLAPKDKDAFEVLAEAADRELGAIRASDRNNGNAAGAGGDPMQVGWML